MEDYFGSYGTEWSGETGGAGYYESYSAGVGDSVSGGSSGFLDTVGGLFSKAANTYIDVARNKELLAQRNQYGLPYIEGQAAIQQRQGISPLVLLLLVGGFVLATRN